MTSDRYHLTNPNQLEDASGGRYFMKGDLAADRAVYDAVFAGISTQWPQYTENLDVCMFPAAGQTE